MLLLRFSINFIVLVVTIPFAGLAQDQAHDVFICAAVNKNYVIGSKIVTTSGLLKLRQDESWQHIGINDPKIFAVSFDPRNHDIFYTATLNGAMRTMDGGENWRIMTGWDITEPKDICVDPHSPDTVFLAHPAGIARSGDQGQTWTHLDKGLPARGRYTQTIEVDRANKGHVLAGCEIGIYLSRNGGDSWKRTLATGETVNDVQQSPHDPDTWAAVTQSAGGWISTNGGNSWQPLNGTPTQAALYNIAFDPTDPERLAIGSYTYGVLTSEDGGKSWTPRNDGLPADHHVWRVGIHPDSGQLLASVYQEALYVSDDFGRTWKRDGLEGSEINCFEFLPKDSRPIQP